MNTTRTCKLEGCENTFQVTGVNSRKLFCSKKCTKKDSARRIKRKYSAAYRKANNPQYAENRRIKQNERRELKRLANPTNPVAQSRGTTLSPDEIYYKDYKEPLKKVETGYGYMGTVAYSKSMDKVQCHICGLAFEALGQHIYSGHKIKTADYKKQFGLSPATALIGERLRDIHIKRAMHIYAENSDKLIEGRKEFYKTHKGKLDRTRSKQSLEYKNLNGTCPDQLLDKIQKLAERLHKTPSTPEFIREYGSEKYYDRIRETFGSWENALRMLHMKGVTQEQIERHEPAKLLEYLRNFYKIHGRLATTSDARRALIPSCTTYQKKFGTMNEARILAGLPTIQAINYKGRFRNVETTDHLTTEQLEWVEKARRGEFREKTLSLTVIEE